MFLESVCVGEGPARPGRMSRVVLEKGKKVRAPCRGQRVGRSLQQGHQNGVSQQRLTPIQGCEQGDAGLYTARIDEQPSLQIVEVVESEELRLTGLKAVEEIESALVVSRLPSRMDALERIHGCAAAKRQEQQAQKQRQGEMTRSTAAKRLDAN